MDPLATQGDLEDRIGELTEAQAARAPALLTDASAKVRRYTRRTFTAVEDDVIVLRAVDAELVLPQTPVSKVTQVKGIGLDGLASVPVVGWVFDGIDKVALAAPGVVINLPAFLEDEPFDTYEVIYSHGFAEAPDDVVGVVCRMVLRCLTVPTTAAGVTSESVGPYSYRLETAGAGTSVQMLQEDKDELKDYRQTVGTTRLRMGAGVPRW